MGYYDNKVKIVNELKKWATIMAEADSTDKCLNVELFKAQSFERYGFSDKVIDAIINNQILLKVLIKKDDMIFSGMTNISEIKNIKDRNAENKMKQDEENLDEVFEAKEKKEKEKTEEKEQTKQTEKIEKVKKINNIIKVSEEFKDDVDLDCEDEEDEMIKPELDKPKPELPKDYDFGFEDSDPESKGEN